MRKEERWHFDHKVNTAPDRVPLVVSIGSAFQKVLIAGIIVIGAIQAWPYLQP